MTRAHRPASLALLGLVLFAPLLSACSEGEAQAPKTAAAPPPAAVSVVTVEARSLPVTNELPGRIAPTRIAEVRPRVSGIVVERVFEQGSMVKAGDVLYRIDPAPFRVQVARAEATLQRAEAARVQASQTSARQQELRQKRISSVQELDDSVAALAQANADVALAEAGLAEAKLAFDYSEVRAPIGGRIGRAIVTEGALVSANGAESLATIQQLDPVYADFTQSANALMRLRQALKVGTLSNPDATPVELRFDDGSAYAHPGKLLFSEASVDETTGQVTLRGEFPNPDGDLLPGMYVRIRIEQGVQKNALSVPQQAIQRDPTGGAMVYVVTKENKVEFRPVRLDRPVGTDFVVAEGLSAGDTIIVEGFQKARPGAVVQPTPWEGAKKPDTAQVSQAG